MYQVRVTTRDEYDDMPHCEKIVSGYGRQARECRQMADFRVEYELPGSGDGVAQWICRDHVGVRTAELVLKLPVEADDESGECEGHESLRGDSMGVSVYCDGSCVAVSH